MKSISKTEKIFTIVSIGIGVIMAFVLFIGNPVMFVPIFALFSVTIGIILSKHNKTASVLCFVLAVIGTVSVIIYAIKTENNRKYHEELKENYHHTVNIISDDIENFEALCKYDFEHYEEFEYSEKYGYYAAGIVREPFRKEREMLFCELGINSGKGSKGFDIELIYPEEGIIIFSDRTGVLMRLVYYRNGNNGDLNCYEKIGGHFVTYIDIENDKVKMLSGQSEFSSD